MLQKLRCGNAPMPSWFKANPPPSGRHEFRALSGEAPDSSS
jgi:hypothetical protein